MSMHQSAQCRPKTKNSFVSMSADTAGRDDPPTERLGREREQRELPRARENLRGGTSHITCQRHWSSAFADDTEIISVVPPDPNNDGRSTISDDWQAQKEILAIRLMKPDVLTKEHDPRKPLATSEAKEIISVSQRDTTSLHDLSCRKREPTKVSDRNTARAIRECPCDEMHSEHHQMQCGAEALHSPPDSH